MLSIDFQHLRQKMGTTVGGDAICGQANIPELPFTAEHAAEPIGKGEILPCHQRHVGALPSKSFGVGGDMKMGIAVADEYDIGVMRAGAIPVGAIFIGESRVTAIGRWRLSFWHASIRAGSRTSV
jgi:hypothetical protein